MHRHPLRPRLVALTLGLAALLGGCGGGDALPPGATPLTPAPDTTAPSVAIVSGAAGSTAAGDVTFTFTFSENVGTSFTADDVVVTGGSKGAFAMPSGTRATLVVTPNAGTSGSIDVNVPAGRYSDLAGNLNTAVAATSQAYNTVAGAIGSGSTGGCTAAPCIDFGAAGLAMVPFGGLAAEIVADPGDAANKVIKLLKVPSAEVWAGATVDPSGTGVAKVTVFGFGTSKVVTLRVLSPAAGETIMLKVESAADGGVFMEAQAITTLANQWETLTFDFGAPTNGSYDASKTYDRVSIFPHYGTKVTADKIFYADELKYSAASAGGGAGCGSTEPSCAPATTVPAGAVTIYSEAAQVTGFNPKPDWGQAPPVTYSEVTIAGNKSLKYGFTAPALYEGLDWANNPVDVTAKGKLHIDFWSADIGSVKVSIISNGKENAVTQALTAGSWNSVDIDLAQYTVPDKAAIIQIKLEPNVAGTLYVDNIYFWGSAVAAGCGTTEPTCAPTTTVPAGAVTIYSEAAQVATFNPKPDWGQAPPVTYSEVTIAGNKSLKYGFTAPALYEGLDWANNPVDVTAKGKLHIDFWSADIGSVKVSIISNGKENAVTQALTAGSWNSVDIDLAQYTVPDKAAIIQIKLEPNVAGTLYVDNIYFWGSAAGGGGGGGGAPVAFSTGFGAGGVTVEGGAFGGYSGSSLDNFNCTGGPSWCGSGGSFTPTVAAAASSFFYYYQTPSPVTSLYAGVFIQAPGLTTGLSGTGDTPGVSIAGKTTMKFTLGQNAEWFSSPTNNFGVILTLGKFYDVDAGPAVAPCNIKLLAVVTPSAAAASNYAIPLSSFGLIQTCNVAGLDVAAALALAPLSQVDFQAVGTGNPLPAIGGKLVGANMSVGVGAPAVYPSTIALGGGITFE